MKGAIRGLAALVRRPVVGSTLVVLLVAGSLSGALRLWADYHFRAAQQALHDERIAEARQHIHLCLKGWGNGPARLLAARIEWTAGDYAAAEKQLHDYRQRYGMNEDLQLEWLLLRARRGELDEVEAGLLQGAREGHRQALLILQTLARVSLDQQRFDRALAYLNLWLKKAPDTVQALDWRGWVLERMERFDAAAADDRRVLELAPQRHAVHLRLASLLLASSTPMEALPHFQQLEHALPESPEVLTGLARCRLLQGRSDEALRLLDRALTVAPTDAQALLWRGKLALERGHADAAERYLRRALEQDPAMLEGHLRLVDCLRSQSGREQETERERKKYEQLESDVKRLSRLLNVEMPRSAANDPQVPAEIGELFLRLGQERQGVRWLEEVALKRDRRHAHSHALLARYYDKTDARAAEYHRKQASLSLPGQER